MLGAVEFHKLVQEVYGKDQSDDMQFVSVLSSWLTCIKFRQHNLRISDLSAQTIVALTFSPMAPAASRLVGTGQKSMAVNWWISFSSATQSQTEVSNRMS